MHIGLKFCTCKYVFERLQSTQVGHHALHSGGASCTRLWTEVVLREGQSLWNVPKPDAGHTYRYASVSW